MKNGDAIAIYDIAAKHLPTAQVCVDRQGVYTPELVFQIWLLPRRL